ncbi:ABC transporter integral membrane type 1 [Penicillium cf. viridicatum]|uniref:ABC transporter integral membrane type 1 n=1 Tax=Penicillium cf. viridicatum TaxID=2972119 RepID=A0A9W9N551_9EURO|nr:ABC transporter integral membrane type 1 [Penicillium cf. viridicatum]
MLRNNIDSSLLGVALNNILRFNQLGEINIQELSLRYYNGTLALDNISIYIRPGKKIGIYSRTSSGKSSLILAMLRLVDFSHNRPGINPREADSGAIGFTLLKDHPLSQGEQQLFCLARAILKRQTSNGGCQVLILDEATSSLDAQTDRQVQRVIREAFHDCTVFSVAYRVCSLFCLLPKRKLIVEQLDTIIDFDRIAVLDAGCLVEFDTPQNLLAREGLFKQMYSGTDGQEI